MRLSERVFADQPAIKIYVDIMHFRGHTEACNHSSDKLPKYFFATIAYNPSTCNTSAPSLLSSHLGTILCHLY